MKASLPPWLSALIVIVVVPFFFIGGPTITSSFLLNNIWNFGHIIFFTVLMLGIQSFKPLNHWRQWLVVTFIAVALGCLIEGIQYYVGRNPTVQDVLHNVFGVWLGLFWGQKANRLVWVLRLVSAGLVAPSLWLVVDSAIASIIMQRQFPMINSFESRFELQQVRANKAQVRPAKTDVMYSEGRHALRVSLGTQPYSGVSVLAAYGDWGTYANLSMDLYSAASDSVELVVRISDTQHDLNGHSFNDRFNQRITLHPGWNRVSFNIEDIRSAPQCRAMQMDSINYITIFAAKLSEPYEFYLDAIKLH